MTDIISRLRQGGGRLSGDAAIHAAAERIGCEARVLLAVIETESAGQPFDGSGRLIILPEKHVFWRELPKALRAAARAKGLAVPKWSRANYKGLGGAGSDTRWDRLEAMVRMDETAGLRSASYGGPQIMGFNAELCGYASVQAFVLAFAQSEAAQQDAFITYLEKVGLAQALRDKDFRAIAPALQRLRPGRPLRVHDGRRLQPPCGARRRRGGQRRHAPPAPRIGRLPRQGVAGAPGRAGLSRPPG